MHRLDIGIASYKSASKLRTTIETIAVNTEQEHRIHILHNPSPGDEECQELLINLSKQPHIETRVLPTNLGYAGAVAEMQRTFLGSQGAGGKDWSHFQYFDNDVRVLTKGWDVQMVELLDSHPEIGLLFPNAAPAMIPRNGYTECMWGIGFAWMTTRKVVTEVGTFDTSLGHQEEADYSLRVRMAGYKCACVPSITVQHDATTTNDPAAQERINQGVIAFVDKWNRYFNGKQYGYHHPNVTRWDDWPPNALYLEEYYLQRVPDLNSNPEKIQIDGAIKDLLRVPRPENFYKNRII